jgi:hypothetical protein
MIFLLHTETTGSICFGDKNTSPTGDVPSNVLPTVWPSLGLREERF